MAPPSKLAITTSALKRLMKDKASYGKEEIQQEQRIKKLETETGDENAGYILEQEVCNPDNIRCMIVDIPDRRIAQSFARDQEHVPEA